MADIYYVGDRAIEIGPVFAETPFNYSYKGLSTHEYDKWLADALAADSRHSVCSVATWEFYQQPPGAYQEVLDEADVLVFSDVEAKNFQLNPSFFEREQFGGEPLTYPDRVRLTVDAIRDGTHAMFLGGWLSFTGELGKGGWGRTPLREVLPVECLDHEDLRESTEGFTPTVTAPDHQLAESLDLDGMPPALGYNVVKPREGADVIAEWAGEGDPMLSVGEYGDGRTLAYTSDPAPHWGLNVVHWDGYDAFWQRALDWLLSDDSA